VVKTISPENRGSIGGCAERCGLGQGQIPHLEWGWEVRWRACLLGLCHPKYCTDDDNRQNATTTKRHPPWSHGRNAIQNCSVLHITTCECTQMAMALPNYCDGKKMRMGQTMPTQHYYNSGATACTYVEGVLQLRCCRALQKPQEMLLH
jgi:hypothetical protein